MKKYVLFLVVLPGFFLAAFVRAAERPEPNAAQMKRIREGVEIYGIVHWGLNTFTDREWGFGDENPADLNPAKFDAEQIVDFSKQRKIRYAKLTALHAVKGEPLFNVDHKWAVVFY